MEEITFYILSFLSISMYSVENEDKLRRTLLMFFLIKFVSKEGRCHLIETHSTAHLLLIFLMIIVKKKKKKIRNGSIVINPSFDVPVDIVLLYIFSLLLLFSYPLFSFLFFSFLQVIIIIIIIINNMVYHKIEKKR